MWLGVENQTIGYSTITRGREGGTPLCARPIDNGPPDDAMCCLGKLFLLLLFPLSLDGGHSSSSDPLLRVHTENGTDSVEFGPSRCSRMRLEKLY